MDRRIGAGQSKGNMLGKVGIGGSWGIENRRRGTGS